MFRFSFTVYKNSVIATILSCFGTGYCFIGVMLLILGIVGKDPSMNILTGIIVSIVFAVLGLCHIALAKSISQNKHCKNLIKNLEVLGLDKQITVSTEFAVATYYKCPTKKMRV